MTRIERLRQRQAQLKSQRRFRVLVLALTVAITGALSALGASAAVGPGDQPCVPGQHGNPAPGFKAAPCPGP